MGEYCDCPLAGQIEVPYAGNKKGEIAIVGESPGNNELRHGQPFIDDAGNMIKNCFRAAGLSWRKTRVLNAARCLVKTDELGDSEIREIMGCCRAKLEKALHALKPKAIIAVGGWSHYQVMKQKKVVKNVRGLWKWSEEFNCWVMTTYHPAYILRNRARKPILIEDLKLVADLQARDFEMQQDADDDLKWIEVNTIEPLLQKQRPFVISLDTETLGLDWKAEPPVILCYSIGIRTGRAATIRLFEECELEEALFTVIVKRIPEGRKKAIPTEAGVRKCANFKQKIKELIALCEDDQIKKIMQHGSFDVHYIREFVKYWTKHDLTFRGYTLDTQSGAHVLDENLFTMSSLETLQTHLTDFRNDYWRMFQDDYNKNDMLSVPTDKLVYYASGDADVTYRVGKSILQQLKKQPQLDNYYKQFVQPALNVLIEMEKNGIRIDKKALPSVKKEVAAEVADLQAQALALVPSDLLSRHQEARKKKKDNVKLTQGDFLKEVVFSKDGFGVATAGLKMTKSKSISLDKENRQILQERRLPKKAAKFIEIYERWQILHTMLTRYLTGFDKHIKSDGRIHTNYSLSKTVTGRSSSADPNMQNQPKRSKEAARIRRLLCAEDGWVLLAADESQCLTADTEIITIDGIKTLADVIKHHLPVLAVHDNRKLIFRDVKHGWSTGVKKVYRVLLDDGSFVDCTKLHKFLRYNGQYATLEELKVGDSLAHVHDRSEYYPTWRLGIQGYTTKANKISSVRKHRIVGEYLNKGPLLDNQIIHHKDEDKKNWTRSNLEVFADGSSHMKTCHAKGEKNANYGHRKGRIVTCPVCGKQIYRHPSQLQYVTCGKSCSNIYFPQRYASGSRGGDNNHKIKSISYLGKKETFQIEVDVDHNYVLANGLVSKNSELRWIAHIANEETMIRVYKQGIDIHKETGSILAGKDFKTLSEKEQKDIRQKAKAANFGGIYGISPMGYQRSAWLNYKVKLTEDQAKQHLSLLLDVKYPGLRRFHKRIVAECREKGYVTAPLGRRRRLPEIVSDDRKLRAEAERQAINSPVQNVSSDVVLLAASEISKELDPNEARILAFIHDELIFEVRDDPEIIMRYYKLIKRHMENPPLERFGVKMRVPLVANAKIGKNLADMEELTDDYYEKKRKGSVGTS